MRVGAIEFCFGGRALELSRSGAELGSVVSFHGLLKTATSAQPGAVEAKVLTITGAKDPYAPAEDVGAFVQEITDAGADWQVIVAKASTPSPPQTSARLARRAPPTIPF